MKLIIKIIILIAILMAGLYFYLTCSGQSCLVQRIDKMEPDATKAPFTVITYTHTYFAEKAVKESNGDVIMTGWYEKVKDKWVFHKGAEVIPQRILGDIKIERR